MDTSSVFGLGGPRVRFFEYFAVQDNGQEALGVIALGSGHSGAVLSRWPAVRGVVSVESAGLEADAVSDFFRVASLSRDELAAFFELSLEVKREVMKISPSQPESLQTAV